MGVILQTIDEYAAKSVREKTYWIVFNKRYNDVHAFKKKLNEEDSFLYLNRKSVDYEMQKEFLAFMKEELPHIEITQVFDLVSVGYIEYPYLGSYAIDVEETTMEYEKIIQKYEEKDGTPKSNNAVIYEIEREKAQQIFEKRKAFFDEEFDNEKSGLCN